MKYFVFETQETEGGTAASLTSVEPDRAHGLQKHYLNMAAAAVSEIKYHGSIIISADHSFIRHEIADREEPETITEGGENDGLDTGI